MTMGFARRRPPRLRPQQPSGWVWPPDDAAYSLLEAVIVLSLIATLAALLTPWAIQRVADAKVGRAVDDLRTIEKAITVWELERLAVPDTLTQIGLDGALDPWGRRYEYYPFKEKGWRNKARKDQFLVPLNSTYDLYSRGPDGDTQTPLQNPQSWDDVVRADDGAFVGLAREF